MTRETNSNQINTFWPSDTETEFYISESEGLKEIMEQIKNKWPDSKPEEIRIDACYIQTNSLGYDLYDPTDYTRFLKISYTK